MLDSGASHNLMPKAVMEKLGLEVTRPYKDLHSFDSSKVRCIGLIKDLCITLVQIPAKSMVMDVVVADIPMKYRNISLSVLGGQAERYPAARYVLCHYPYFQATKKAI
jgi:hypothetical protein